MSKVNKILVIPIDSDICKRSPSSLNLLSCHLVFGFEFHFLLSFKETTPCPLDLYCSNMVHCKPMIFKQSSGQTHFISRLYYRSTEVPEALVFIFMHDVETACQELLSEFLGCGQMLAHVTLLISHSFLVHECHHLSWVHDFLVSKPMLTACNLVHSLILLGHLVYLSQLLQLLLILCLLLKISILHILSY